MVTASEKCIAPDAVKKMDVNGQKKKEMDQRGQLKTLQGFVFLEGSW